MNALTAVFRFLLNLSLTALPALAAVLLARLCLRRAPKKYSYALWAVAGFRLLCPFSPPSPVSLFNAAPVSAARTSAQSAVREWGQAVPAFPSIPPAAQAAGSAADHTAGAAAGTAGDAALILPAAQPGPSVMEVLAVIWVVGLAAMLVWGLVSWLRVRRDVRQGVLLEKGVYQCDGLKTPFVLGLFRPKIYVPFHMEEGELTHVLLHERTHLRRLDPWWKLLAFGILAVYWWNAAVWLCFFLFCRDMEMSCDEAVLRRMGPEAKRSYSLSLVRFAAGGRFPAAGPLAFGESGAKSRIKHILRWKKAAPAAAFLAAAVCLLAAVICGTDASAGRGWVQSEGTVSAGGRTELRVSYSVPRDINSCLFYTEVYDHGELISQDVAACFDFNGEVNHAERKGTAALSGFINNGHQDGGWYFGGILSGAGLSVPFSLPQRSYLGYSGPSFPGDGARGSRLNLSELDAAAALCLSDDDGKLSSANSLSRDFSPAGLFADGLTDVAAVLRVQFSRLSAEEFQAEFEKNGPGAGAAQDGNRVTLKNASEGANGSGGAGVDFRAELTKPVRSWAIYEDVYDRGVLISSIPRFSDGFAEDGGGATPRKFSGTLLGRFQERPSGEPGGAFAGVLDCSYGETGSPATAGWSVSLPAERYASVAMVPGGSGDTISLADAHEAVLATYVCAENGAVTVYAETADIALSNDAAVRFRLVTSVEPVKNSPGRSALELYALKNPYLGDAAADGKLLKALHVEDELGGYTMELFTSNAPLTLRVNLKKEPGAAEHAVMVRDSFALLALIQNLDAVRWDYPLNGKHSSFSLDTAAVNGVLERDGLPDVKTCGASLENLQALLYRLSQEDAASYGAESGGGFQTPFAGILGYDGYLLRKPGAGGFSICHYIAEKDGRELCIAESWGWERSDHAVDLDGDGVQELICNVTYGADGANRVMLYRRGVDGFVEYADPLELLDVPHEDWGVNALLESYDAGRGMVDISYIPRGQDGGRKDWETTSYSPDMEKLTFLPFVCSEPS